MVPGVKLLIAISEDVINGLGALQVGPTRLHESNVKFAGLEQLPVKL